MINLNFRIDQRMEIFISCCFLFFTQVETQSNQMRSDGGKSNEWENKENTEQNEEKVSSYVHSIFSLTPKNEFKSVHICKRQEKSSKFSESSSSSSMCFRIQMKAFPFYVTHKDVLLLLLARNV